MRTARLLGLSPDGRSLLLTVDGGEEIALAADDRLRAAVRGDRPRLGQLEIQMESSLSPRDIQTRIRGGDSLEDVARVAGLPLDRVERFAAPVLAEREHVAAMAMSSSVRRPGETSGHRNLRIAVTERLVQRGIDIDVVTWDSFRLDDGRWAVTADYRSGESERHASFTFDLRARFSVATNDEARWLLGEPSAAKGPQPGRRRPQVVEDPAETGEDDTEPTLDLSDELALVRATAEPTAAGPTTSGPTTTAAGRQRRLRPVADLPPEPAQDQSEQQSEQQPEPESSAIDTLREMFGHPRTPTGEGVREPVGPTDASAVPDTDPGADWEPAPVVEIPVEPSVAEEDDQSFAADGAAQEPTEEPTPTEDAAPTDEVGSADAESAEPEPAELESEAEPEFALEPVPPAKPVKRKRAAVPSWDDIMFGGPKRP